MIFSQILDAAFRLYIIDAFLDILYCVYQILLISIHFTQRLLTMFKHFVL